MYIYRFFMIYTGLHKDVLNTYIFLDIVMFNIILCFFNKINNRINRISLAAVLHCCDIRLSCEV